MRKGQGVFQAASLGGEGFCGKDRRRDNQQKRSWSNQGRDLQHTALLHSRWSWNQDRCFHQGMPPDVSLVSEPRVTSITAPDPQCLN